MKNDKALTPWGKFVMEYSVMVPINLWNHIKEEAEQFMETGQGWEFFLSELSAGCDMLSIYRMSEIWANKEEQND